MTYNFINGVFGRVPTRGGASKYLFMLKWNGLLSLNYFADLVLVACSKMFKQHYPLLFWGPANPLAQLCWWNLGCSKTNCFAEGPPSFSTIDYTPLICKKLMELFPRDIWAAAAAAAPPMQFSHTCTLKNPYLKKLYHSRARCFSSNPRSKTFKNDGELVPFISYHKKVPKRQKKIARVPPYGALPLLVNRISPL